MKAIINMTTAFLLLLMFLFGWSLVTYNENPEKYQWLDANGEFKTSTYDVEVSYNLDTSQDDLNGYSLKEVFEEENYLTFSTGQTYRVTDIVYNGNSVSYTPTTVGVGFLGITPSLPITSANYYIRFSLNAQVGNTYRFAFGNAYYKTFDLDYQNQVFSYRHDNRVKGNRNYFEIWNLDNDQNSFITWFDVYLINLTDLGINQTKDEMDYWYSEYQRLQDNQIENYKELGSTVESSWQFLTGYFTTLVDIVGRQLDFILNPIDFIITVPIFGL